MSSPVSKITDYERRMSDNMLSQFHGDPVHEAISKVIADEYQLFENVAHDVLTKRDLDSAVGDILDQWGTVAGVDRLGRSDDDYRNIIKVALAANASDGGAEEIIWIATVLVRAEVHYIQEGTAYFTLQYVSDSTLSDDLKTEAIELINRAAPAGVGWRLIAGEETDTGRYDADTFGAGYYGTVIGGSAS